MEKGKCDAHWRWFLVPAYVARIATTQSRTHGSAAYMVTRHAITHALGSQERRCRSEFVSPGEIARLFPIRKPLILNSIASCSEEGPRCSSTSNSAKARLKKSLPLRSGG